MNQGQTNQILTCIIDGMRSHQPATIRDAAANALINSLDFTRTNFDSQQERDVIMQVGEGATPRRVPVDASAACTDTPPLAYLEISRDSDVIGAKRTVARWNKTLVDEALGRYLC